MKKSSVQSQSDMKINNCKLVLNIIRDNQDYFISRADIAKITKMSATSITRITDELMSLGLIKQAERVSKGKVGRKGTSLRVIEEAILTVGIAIDSDFIDVCILNFLDQIIANKKVKLEKRKYQPEEIIQIAYEIYTELYNNIPYKVKNTKAIGISSIGNVDYSTGKIFFAPQFQWTNVDFGEMAKKVFQLPVFVDNDMKSTLIGLAHRYKEIRYEDVTYLTIGTGVGSAVMYRGTLIRGSNNAAGEVGHIILESSGRQCDCGRTGCVQTYLTKDSLIEQCVEKGKDINDVSQIYEAYRRNEEWAKLFIENQSRHLAMLIRNLVYMYNTKYILVGGSIPSDFPELYDLAIKKLSYLIHENLYESLEIQLIEKRDNSGEGSAFVVQGLFLESFLNSELNI